MSTKDHTLRLVFTDSMSRPSELLAVGALATVKPPLVAAETSIAGIPSATSGAPADVDDEVEVDAAVELDEAAPAAVELEAAAPAAVELDEAAPSAVELDAAPAAAPAAAPFFFLSFFLSLAALWGRISAQIDS